MFKEILQFSLFVSLVVAGNSSEESGGLCLDQEEVLYWCAAGTPLGEKLSGALNTCSSPEEEGGEKNCKKGKKCPGKGKGLSAGGKKCPSVDEAEAWFMEDHQGRRVSDVCL